MQNISPVIVLLSIFSLSNSKAIFFHLEYAAILRRHSRTNVFIKLTWL